MDQTLKKRLTGIAVLLLLAMLLLPLIFDGANQKGLLEDTRLPPPPEVPAAEVLLASPPAELAEVEGAIAREHQPAEPEAPAVIPPVAVAAVPAAVPAPVPAAAPASTPTAGVTTDPRLASLAEAWDVQVAALGSAEGTAALVKKLQSAGYKVRVTKAGNLHKVLVGPELRRAAAEKLQAALAADARVGKLQGRLVRYVP